ncbi:MAG: hypothetical protein ACR2PO_14085 [Methyloligellaceae bacterium]
MKYSAIVAAVAMAFAVAQPRKAEARPGEYVAIAAGMAVSPATAAILAQNRFHQPNRYRRYLGPNYIATYYRPYRSSKARRVRHRARRKYRGRR